MEIDSIHVQLRCLFCDAVLTGSVDEKPNSGDLIACPSCGQGNDYDGVLEVAKQKGMTQMKEVAKKKIEEEFKKMFKR